MKRKRKKNSTTPNRTAFAERVYEVVAGIPRGHTMTYREVAARAGSTNAARAVGSLMKKNTDPSVPCHRVIKSDGTIGEYNRGKEEKRKKLKAEGARFKR